jgi:hypothetical protein
VIVSMMRLEESMTITLNLPNGTQQRRRCGKSS